MGQKILGKNLELVMEYYDGVDTNTTTVPGINSFEFNKDYSDTDTTDNDSNGNQESLPTSIGRSIDIEGNRLEDASGNLDTGQEYLESYSNNVGYDAVASFTLSTQNGDGVHKSFDAWPSFDNPISGGHEDHVAWSGTLNINGTVSTTVS